MLRVHECVYVFLISRQGTWFINQVLVYKLFLVLYNSTSSATSMFFQSNSFSGNAVRKSQNKSVVSRWAHMSNLSSAVALLQPPPSEVYGALQVCYRHPLSSYCK